jgi:hypothetical protein
MATAISNVSQQAQNNTGSQGVSLLMLFLGIGTPILLIGGGGLFLLVWRRHAKQSETAVQGIFGDAQPFPMQSALADAQTAAWMNNYQMPPTTDVPQYALSGALASSMSGALPVLGSTQVMSLSQPAYTSSDLRPITAAFPRQMLTAASNSSISAPNGDLQPLPMDALGLPLPSDGGAPHTNGRVPVPPTQPTGVIDIPMLSTPSLLPAWMEGLIPPAPSMPSPLPIPPATPPTTQPPSLKEDPILEEVMRQAQAGLFVLSGR